jgi:hypothetical protein
MHGSRFRFQVPVPVSLYRCIAVSLFSSSRICLSRQVRNGLSTVLLQVVVTAAAMLFSTGLSRVVVTELQQCCFQQACRKLLTQSCSNAVFNNLRQTCCEPRKAPYEASCIHYFEQKTAKQVAIFRL